MWSLNTLAGRLLARTSTTDFKKLQEAMKPKYNVDEKGAIVLGHELGKVIGFGAWGLSESVLTSKMEPYEL